MKLFACINEFYETNLIMQYGLFVYSSYLVVQPMSLIGNVIQRPM